MLLAVVSFVVILGLLVLVHELGHFIVARRCGVKVEEFGIGFPPRMFGVVRDPTSRRFRLVGPTSAKPAGTIYSVNWVPLGGFVRIKGEQGEDAAEPDSFAHQGAGRRILIISAGVLMNVMAAFAILSFGFAVGLPQVLSEALPRGAIVSHQKIQIVEVVVGLPAARGGLQLGDVLASIDGQAFGAMEDVQRYLDGKINTPVSVVVDRAGSMVERSMVPTKLPGQNRGGLGIGLVRTGIVRYGLPWAIVHGAESTLNLTVDILREFGRIFVHLIRRQPVDVDLSGPVGIAAISGEVSRLGFRYVLQFTALLSLNLAIINFLPFPALDGGRVLFLLLAQLRGRALNARIEAAFHNVGFIILMLLVLFITYRDIFKLITGTLPGV